MDWSLPAFLVLAVLGVQLARIDLAHHLLPNPLVLTLFIAGLVLFAVSSSASAGWSDLLRAAAGAVILFVVYLILAIISPRGIGMGDVKLAAPVGLYLGYLGWSQLFYGGALGFVLGGVVSAVLLKFKSAGKASEIAFGPSMLAAALGLILFPPSFCPRIFCVALLSSRIPSFRSQNAGLAQRWRKKRAALSRLAQDAARSISMGGFPLLTFLQSWCRTSLPNSLRSSNAFSLHQPLQPASAATRRAPPPSNTASWSPSSPSSSSLPSRSSAAR